MAREFNVEEGLKMYEAWIRWRAEFSADCMEVDRLWPLLLKETLVFGGIDKHKRLTMVCRPRYHTPGEFELDELIRYGIFLMEAAM